MSVTYCLLRNHLVPPDARAPGTPSLSREPAVFIQALRAGEHGQMRSSVAAFFPDTLEPGFTVSHEMPTCLQGSWEVSEGSGELSHSSAISQGFLALALLTWNMKEYLPPRFAVRKFWAFHSAQSLVRIQQVWFMSFLSSVTGFVRSLLQTWVSCPLHCGQVGLEQARGFPPGLNRLVLKQNGRRAFPSSAGRASLPGGGTTSSCFRQRRG